MTTTTPPITVENLQGYLSPWHASLNHPADTQADVLKFLLSIYSETNYGREHQADQVKTIADYRQAFPVCTHADYKPLIDQVMAGDYKTLINEEPVGWAITRGTTKGEMKFIPMTPTDLGFRVAPDEPCLTTSPRPAGSICSTGSTSTLIFLRM